MLHVMEIVFFCLTVLSAIDGIKSIRNINYVKPGGTTTLNCSSSKMNIVSWRHADVVYSIGSKINGELSESKFSVVGNHAEGQYNLRITNISRSDEGVYWCVSDTDDSIIEIKLMVPPSSLVIVNQRRNILISEVGETVSLTCTVSSGLPFETLYWYRDNRILAHGSGKLVYNFTAKDDDHLQTFVCKAKHEALENDLEASVQITFPRKHVVIIRAQPQNAMIGQDVTLSCRVDNPLSLTNIDWTKNGALLHMKSIDIVLENITTHDLGTYTCRVANEFGNTSSSYTFNISDFKTSNIATDLTTDFASETGYTERHLMTGPGEDFNRHDLYYGLFGIACIVIFGSVISCLIHVRCLNIKCVPHFTADLVVSVVNSDDVDVSRDETSSYEEINENQLVVLGNTSDKTDTSTSSNTDGASLNTGSSSSVVIKPTFDQQNYLNPYNYLSRKTDNVHPYSAFSQPPASEYVSETELKQIENHEELLKRTESLKDDYFLSSSA